MSKTTLLGMLLSILLTPVLRAQQVPDTAFNYSNPTPRYAAGKGPVVWLDAAHGNFHTLEGRYAAFGRVVRGDGYQIKSNTKAFTLSSLANCRVLVIANALDSASQGQWRLPNRSAFTPAEIKAVQQWVRGGGSLFLIADHMPFAGSAADLAGVFGVEMLNCFAMDNRRRFPERFYRGNRALIDCPLVADIDTIVTFTGSAFKLPAGAQPVLQLHEYTLLSPETAWQFTDTTPHQSGAGWYQLGYLSYGKGKVVVSGEAAMFSAQLAGQNQRPMGMNAAYARQNPALLLEIINWLTE